MGGFSAIKMSALAGPQFLVGGRGPFTDPDPAVYTLILSHKCKRTENMDPVLVSCFPVNVEWNLR